MLQGFSPRLSGYRPRPSPRGERPHGGTLRLLLLTGVLGLWLPTLAGAQSGAALQVAANVLSAEPSRSALPLVSAGIRARGGAIRQSVLAQVTVLPARSAARGPRQVRIDFLRN